MKKIYHITGIEGNKPVSFLLRAKTIRDAKRYCEDNKIVSSVVTFSPLNKYF